MWPLSPFLPTCPLTCPLTRWSLWVPPLLLGSCIHYYAFFEPPISSLTVFLGEKVLEPGCLDSHPALPLAGWASSGECLYSGASGPHVERGDVSTYLPLVPGGF